MSNTIHVKFAHVVTTVYEVMANGEVVAFALDDDKRGFTVNREDIRGHEKRDPFVVLGRRDEKAED